MGAWVDPQVDPLGALTESAWGDLCYVRTDARTNEESWLRTIDTSPSVTRARTYGFPHSSIARARTDRTAAKETP